jgi:hypothetical protein
MRHVVEMVTVPENPEGMPVGLGDAHERSVSSVELNVCGGTEGRQVPTANIAVDAASHRRAGEDERKERGDDEFHWKNVLHGVSCLIRRHCLERREGESLFHESLVFVILVYGGCFTFM